MSTLTTTFPHYSSANGGEEQGAGKGTTNRWRGKYSPTDRFVLFSEHHPDTFAGGRKWMMFMLGMACRNKMSGDEWKL